MKPSRKLLFILVSGMAICLQLLAIQPAISGQSARLSSDSPTWNIATLDSTGGDTGYYTSIAVDKNDQVHISYFDRANQLLKYATNQSGQWEISTVTDDVARMSDTSIAVDSKGNVYIGYVVKGYESPELAVRDTNGTWSFPYLHINEAVDGGLSITVDRNDVVHVAATTSTNYGFKSAHLYYTDNAGGSFATPQQPFLCIQGAITLSSPSISTDSNGNTYIVFIDSNQLVYATNRTGVWRCNYLGSQNTNAILFSNRYSANDSTGAIRLAALDGVGSTALALDKADHRYISDYADGCLRFTTDRSGSQQSTSVDCSSASVGKYNSLALDSEGGVHIAFFDNTNGSLKYAYAGNSAPHTPLGIGIYLPLVIE